MALEPSSVLLGVHVTAGAAALVLGPLAVFASHRLPWRLVLATGYQIAVAVLTTTALGLVGLDPGRLWWLVPFAIGTEAAVLAGWWLGHDVTVGGRVQVTPARVRLMGGSYVSLSTALLVVSWGSSVPAWVLPSLVGVLVVETAAARAGRGRDVHVS